MAAAETPDTPAPMEGHGAYNRASRVQASGISPAIPFFLAAARAVPLAAAPETIVIADYGASEGRNSLEPIGLAIAALRDRTGPDRAISVVHTDLPDNDFGALFRVLDEDPDSYMRGARAVFPAVVGRSFYDAILPPASVTLGWSSWAVQWLSRVPAPIPDQLQVAFSHDAAARAAYARQAAEDWRRFLRGRATELRPGGRLVVLTMALDETGDFGYGPLLPAMYAALGDLVDEGLVHRAEAARMAIPTVARSLTDLRAPFAAAGGFDGLAVEAAEIFLGEDRIWADFEENGDAAAFGRRWAEFSRASVFPTLAQAIAGADATRRAAAFVERMTEALATRLAAAPCKMKIPLARIELAKPA